MNKVLLIADDDEMSRKIISRFLKDEYTVLQAVNGREALEILRRQPVDVLLLDIIMPEMDGLQVLQTMQREPCFARVGVLVATSTKERTERSALSLGADDIVSKPYDPLVIKRRLANILATKELARRQELLQNGDTDALLHQKMNAVATEARALAATLQKYTAIINANKENFKLVAEITAEIDKEATVFADKITAGV